MSQIERNLAAVFLVFVGIFVNQFSLLIAIAVLVVAILVHRGFQMSDLRVNVQNSSRVQTLASSLYTWTESAVSAVAKKCKILTVTENRPSAQNFSSPRQSDVHQDNCSDSENVYNRENLYQGSNLIQVRKVNYTFPEQASPYSTVTSAKKRQYSTSPIAKNLNETHNSPYLRASEKIIFSDRDSPWGFSLSPQQRNAVTDVRPVQAIAGPLLASAKYNPKKNSNLYVDVSSSGFSTLILKCSEAAATHQPQYARPGQLPLVHLNTSPLRTLSPHNSRKVRAPVRVRIAPPSYDVFESRLFSRNDNQQVDEHQSKSVVDVLKEISRKRIRTEDVESDPKRHHRSDSSSSSSSSSSPALGNGISCDQTPSGKRPREEDSPKLQKKTFKRTRNNEIYSSLSSSRNICVGTKRKAADNLSRCSTPSPIGKHLKKSPCPVPVLISKAGEPRSSEWSSQKQQEALPQTKESCSKEENIAACQTLLSPPYPEVAVSDPKPSTSRLEEPHTEDDRTSLAQPSKSQHGRLFVKTFSKGITSEQESMKHRRKNGGSIPWRTRTTVDVDAITGEDIVSQDFSLGSRRLNSMLSAISSSANTSSDSSKTDTVDGSTPKIGSSNPSVSEPEIKLSASSSEVEKQVISSAPTSQADKNFTSATTSITEIMSPRPVSSNSEVTLSKPEQTTAATTDVPVASVPIFGVVQTPSSTPSSLTAAKDKQASEESSEKPPVTSTQSVNLPSLASPATSSAFSLPKITPASVPATSQDTLTPASTASVLGQSSASLTEPSRTFVSVSAAPFSVPQQSEKPPVASTPSFLFGASSASNAPTSSDPKPVFSLPTSTVITTAVVPSASQPTISSPFTVLSTSIATASSTAITTKSDSTPVLAGGFTFGATPVVTSSSVEFPKTTSSIISFGVKSPPITSVSAVPTGAPLTNVTNTTSATSDFTLKPTFSFGTSTASVPASAPAPAITTAGGFSFQFAASPQSTVAAPKLQDAGAGFKFSFGANKESTAISQSPAPSLAKPPAFGEGFTFGSTSTVNSQESKPMTFGTPTSANPTSAPASGGFNFSTNNNPATNIPKPTFGFGTASPSTGTSNPLGTNVSGGFSFGAKPAEPAPIAPTAPNMATPFQFGSTSAAMPAASGLQTQQQQQAPTLGNPFSLAGAAEQKPMDERFTFGSVQSPCMTSLQPNPPSFGQASIPTFGSPTVNPLQNPTPGNPSLFQFGSSTGSMAQPGMFSGGCSFGHAPATGVPSAGFNFNPTGPSATTPFQFGAAPLQAPAMFSIGSGSTAPRSRPRNRRQK